MALQKLHIEDIRLHAYHGCLDEEARIGGKYRVDIMAEADYLIDIGPEAGEGGGEVVAAGTPEEVVKVKGSRTAPFLAVQLGRKP